ncbi:Rpb7-binding protein seb1 [Cyphellophora attinorum]|uniref:Rpb7-binding protein seb1 n=1 Tax=Cyphellophora attinorum TaxID=1664694 RepID=A0A0N0NP71_9EURO|nr:Rpb7-binding protein seb1 [Phialophora attinorum]KPI42199.1 Rpb7-binding protein seb1 [Phialophora attinorum]
MTSAVAELDTVLQSMLSLKPPGATKPKIDAITSLCAANVQSSTVIIQKLFTHFKKAPGPYKLGVLYVVDSVLRQWIDGAKKSGQPLGAGAADGTFAAGVYRITELIDVFVNDTIATAPDDQKDKIMRLFDIWERGNTFPASKRSKWKEQLAAPHKSTTPIGSPRPGFTPLGMANNPQQPAQVTQNAAAQQLPVTTAMPPASLNNILGTHFGGNPGIVNAIGPQGNAVNPLGAMFSGLNNGATSQSPANVPQTNPNPFAALLAPPAAAPAAGPTDPAAQMQLQLIQALAAQGVPPDQWATALQMLNAQTAQNGGNQYGGASRDQDAHTRSPNGRRRSRSPDYGRKRDESPGRRRRGNSPGANPYRENRRGGGGDSYRQRSPQGRRRRSPSPQKNEPNLPPAERNITYDPSLPAGSIKVMSRTLFVGGVTQREPHLRDLFGKFGIVQTCIVNVDKRHAFIKMLTRKDAEKARIGMEDFREGNSQLRTKWGVGFGPRDCSDYQTGVSIIPMERLTDADRKWMVTAEYGGTGGQPMETGMVVEEPDIEIGAGVSSKAMSRRIATDTGGKRGPVSTRTGGDNRPLSRDNNNPNNVPVNPNGNGANMPFNFANMPMPTMPNGMPFQFPPGFFQNFQQQQ